MKTFTCMLGLSLCTLVTPVAAADGPYTAFVTENAAAWLADPVIQSALRAANAAHANLTEADIIDMDNDWRAEIGKADMPLIKQIMSAPASAYLNKIVSESGGRVAEVILMDNRGLNAGISATTSDYWQGDEDKFQQTYDIGPDAVHVSDVELDESTQTYVVQVSMVVQDAAGQPVGAATFSLDASKF